MHKPAANVLDLAGITKRPNGMYLSKTLRHERIGGFQLSPAVPKARHIMAEYTRGSTLDVIADSGVAAVHETASRIERLARTMGVTGRFSLRIVRL